MKGIYVIVGVQELREAVMQHYAKNIPESLFRDLCEIGFYAYCSSRENAYKYPLRTLDPIEAAYVCLGEYLDGCTVRINFTCDLRQSSWFKVVYYSIAVYEEMLAGQNIHFNENYLNPHFTGWLGDSVVIHCFNTERS